MPALKTTECPNLPSNSSNSPAAIYVHWPFCVKKCPYCDFNSHVREDVSQAQWQKALVREIDTMASHFPNLQASSIFFGGGTPSLMAPETVHSVIDAIKKHWGNGSDIEITLEANPSSVEAGRFREYRAAGVNRLSVGIQSLNDTVLRFLGRVHSAAEALKALKVAQDNFECVSFDLIYARPNQNLAEWKSELTEALAFGTSHLSLYQLTIEEGTAFYHQFHRGKFNLPDEDTATALFELTDQTTQDAGLPAYEISNHARAGEQSVHNLAYWQGDAYVGIGPGAHGRLPGTLPGSAFAHAQIKRPEDWLAAVVSRGTGLETLDTVTPQDRAVEAILTGLRLTTGINLANWRHRFGQSLEDIINITSLHDMQDSGHLSYNDTHLKLTKKGRPLLNFILGKLVA